MASSQVLPSPLSKKQEHLEAGKRRLEQFRKKKAGEKAKKVSPSSTDQSKLSGLTANEIEKPYAGSLTAKLLESNGNVLENETCGENTSIVSRSSVSASLSLGLPMARDLSSELRTPENFSQQTVEVQVSAVESIYTNNEALNNPSTVIYSNKPQRPSYGNAQELQEHDTVAPNETNSGYKNGWRKLSFDSLSELTKKPEAKTVDDGSIKSGVVPSKLSLDILECGAGENMDGYPLSQAENLRGTHLAKRNEREDHSIKQFTSEAQLISSSFLRNMQEYSHYSESSQPSAHLISSFVADEVTDKSQLDTHSGSTQAKTDLLESKSIVNQYSSEPVTLGKGKCLEGGVKQLGESSEFHFLDTITNGHWKKADSASAKLDLKTEIRPSTSLLPMDKLDFASRRARPSFLDSISSATTSTSITAQTLQCSEKMDDSKVRKSEESSAVKPWQSLHYEQETSKELGMYDRVPPRLDFSPSRKNDDFEALEQHIEDLTQEKFALQRALDAARALAESLAQENSSLTDAFNQQGAVVGQLKGDLDRQQEEIRAQQLVLNSLKQECDNAQLECSAADERAKILASEVIGLEEKALRLRSNELKLERQLEMVNAEADSYRRHISSLEKDRSDLRLTVDALQEEKKLLQSKLRKAVVNDNLDDIHQTNKRSRDTKDASTSTEDIGFEVFNFPVEGGLLLARQDNATWSIPTSQPLLPSVNIPEVSDAESMGAASSTSFNLPLPAQTTGMDSNHKTHMLDLPVAIPSDQQRMVDNINSVIQELASEKEALARAITAESAAASRLRVLNQELSQKLEAQTQRLELLIAQNMVHEGSNVGHRDFETMNEEIEYADEGDEVVERVLGWIMKLFPGGSSKRRTSKLL